MASVNTLLDLVTAGLMSDSALAAWSSLHYDRQHAVFENCDPRNDPGPDDCPLIVVSADAKSTGESNALKRHVVQVSCIVHDDRTETTMDGVIRFTASRRAEEMRILALAAARGALPNDIHLEDIETEFMPMDEYPLVAVVMALSLTQEKLIGHDPFE
jgi:hypothetical protein